MSTERAVTRVSITLHTEGMSQDDIDAGIVMVVLKAAEIFEVDHVDVSPPSPELDRRLRARFQREET